MARVKLSEYQAKSLIFTALTRSYLALPADIKTTPGQISQFFGQKPLVVKVDQGIKKRGKQGLVAINVTPEQIVDFIHDKAKLGYSQFIIEPYFKHLPENEKYLALERVREGVRVLFGEHGGIEVEANWEGVRESLNEFSHEDKKLEQFVCQLLPIFDQYYLSYLEINPLVVADNQLNILDLAVEIDDAALNLPFVAAQNLTTNSELALEDSEKRIQELDNQTPASLKYRLIYKNGSVWMLLSGGGASLVLADEVADSGHGADLANYGEYSGSPTAEDTYLYTRVLIADLLASKAKQKVLVIAGGVANFTDVFKTFKGVIQALDESKAELKAQKVKVYVRRGGPNQKKGLAFMQNFLEKADLLGIVLGPDKPITDVIKHALENL